MTLHLNNQPIPDQDFPLFLQVHSPALQVEVAKDPRTPVALLDQWAHHRTNVLLMLAIANNPNTAPETLERLADQNDWSVQTAIATHPHTPLAVLWKLFDLHDYNIDDALIRSPNLTDDLSLALLHRPLDDRQLISLASNPTITNHIIEQLINCQTTHAFQDAHLVPLAGRASLSPSQVRELCRRYEENRNDELRAALSQRTDLLPEDYHRLLDTNRQSTSSEFFIRMRLAENPAVPPAILHTLFNQGNAYTLWEYLCNNPACPTEILEYIAKRTRNQTVLRRLRQHPHLTEATKLKLTFKHMTRG